MTDFCKCFCSDIAKQRILLAIMDVAKSWLGMLWTPKKTVMFTLLLWILLRKLFSQGPYLSESLTSCWPISLARKTRNITLTEILRKTKKWGSFPGWRCNWVKKLPWVVNYLLSIYCVEKKLEYCYKVRVLEQTRLGDFSFMVASYGTTFLCY